MKTSHTILALILLSSATLFAETTQIFMQCSVTGPMQESTLEWPQETTDFACEDNENPKSIKMLKLVVASIEYQGEVTLKQSCSSFKTHGFFRFYDSEASSYVQDVKLTSKAGYTISMRLRFAEKMEFPTSLTDNQNGTQCTISKI